MAADGHSPLAYGHTAAAAVNIGFAAAAAHASQVFAMRFLSAQRIGFISLRTVPPLPPADAMAVLRTCSRSVSGLAAWDAAVARPESCGSRGWHPSSSLLISCRTASLGWRLVTPQPARPESCTTSRVVLESGLITIVRLQVVLAVLPPQLCRRHGRW